MTSPRAADIQIVLVVAVAENGVIGSAGAIPWRLKADLQRFKAMTIGKPVVMGRKTFLSLKRPLPNRTNIVMTRDATFRAPGAVVVTSLAAAQTVARADALRRFVSEVAIIGGAEIYAAWIDLADRIELTEVHARPEGDTHFPQLDPGIWQEVSRAKQASAIGDTAPYSYVTYRRISGGLRTAG